MSESRNKLAQGILDALKELGYVRLEYDNGGKVTASISACDAQLSRKKAEALSVIKLRNVLLQAIEIYESKQLEEDWKKCLGEAGCLIRRRKENGNTY